MSRCWVLLVLTCVLAVVLTGCGGNTTPTGEIDSFDFMTTYNDDIRAAAPSEGSSAMRSYTADLPVGEDGTLVRVHWSAFTWEGQQLIASLRFDAVEVARGVELDVGTLGDASNTGTDEFQIMAIPITVRWTKGTLNGQTGGVLVGRITAAGEYEWNGAGSLPGE